MDERDDFDLDKAVLTVSGAPRAAASLSALSEQSLNIPTSHHTVIDALAKLESYLRERAALYRSFAQLPGPFDDPRRAHDTAWADKFEHWAHACGAALAHISDRDAQNLDTAAESLSEIRNREQ